MPWKESRTMDLKLQFVAFALEGDQTITELCSMFGISRKTGHKWLNRYRIRGPEGLYEMAKIPRWIPHRTPQQVVDYVVEQRKKHPSWGARKISQIAAKRATHLNMPSETTLNNIIKREGLMTNKRRRRKPGHPGRPFAVAKEPNEIWTTDFKGEFKTKDGQYCYPLTILDEYSRYLLACTGLDSTGYTGSFKVFRDVFREFGIPRAIKSDNGIPFATTGLARLSALSVWWIKLGIEPILIQPASPAQNGKHERMHRTLKREATIPPSGNRGAQQRRFNGWRNEYNLDRPHEALEGDFPSEHYRPSLRKLPKKIPRVEYPDHFQVRVVSANSCFRWHHKAIRGSSSLIHERIGFEEVLDGVWAVYFYWKRLGFFDERKSRIIDDLGRLTRKKV